MKLNAGNVQNRLGVQENTLAQVNDLMARVNDLTIQASNPALSAADKKTLITELNQIRDGLLSLANADDGTGRYVFGGTNDGDPPFAKINGKVVYRGDQTQRQIEVGPDT
jgi:flagellar hook-associated protein 3 FlgL